MNFFLFFLLFLPSVIFSQNSYFVALESSGGNDSTNLGTINSPFATINKALSIMNSGDTCFVRGGTYYQDVVISNKNNIVLTSYNDEFVCFDGTRKINTNWTNYNGNIFQTTLDNHIWQLFVDNNEMVMARWPNANFTDKSIYNLDSWASGIVDSVAGFPDGSYNGFELVDPSNYNLAATGLNITGAIGIMNVGSFKTYNREITSHNANENFFSYNPVPNNAYRDKHHNFYLEGKLDFLDQANEWYYDTTTMILYLYPDNGQNPNGRNIKGKTQEYAISIDNSNNVTIDNFFFFSTTFLAKSSSGLIIENCHFSFPNCSKRMLKDFLSSPNVTSLGQSGNINNVNNSIIRKCLFEYTDGDALRIYGDNNLVENCYMQYIDYTVSELPFLMVGVYINGDMNRFVHNTIHHSSASAFIAPGTSPEFAYNEVYATGSLQSDGSVYQGTAATVQNSNIHHNYIHDTPKYALRFDAPGGSPGQAGQYGKMHHNIAVRTNGIMVKGNHHYICYNTTFSSNKNGLIILDEDNSNDSSFIYNNFSEKMSAHRANQLPIPGFNSNNWNGYDNPNIHFSSVIDTLNYLPLSNSSLIDSGLIVSNIAHQFSGNSPDIGALEFGITPWHVGVDWQPIHFPWNLGCTDSLAINYNFNATIDDSSCIYNFTDCNGVVNGTSVIDSCGSCIVSGICDISDLSNISCIGISDTIGQTYQFMYLPILGDSFFVSTSDSFSIFLPPSFNLNDWNASCSGCTDPNAVNYDPTATFDDSSCIAIIYGCTDSLAFNYNPTATLDDSSCIAMIYGCTDSLAPNYNIFANTDDGSCILTPCSDLFFSEYIEGSSNNDALEIYNPTNSILDLSNYYIKRYANGSTMYTESFQLSGLIYPKDVTVITNGQTDTSWSGPSPPYTPIDTQLYNLGDLHCNGVYPTPMYYNGDDVITLEKTNGIILDIIGRIGEDPLSGAWTNDSTSGFTLGVGWTKNKTLIRKNNIMIGDNDGLDFFNPSLEWDSLSLGTYSNLGYHYCVCDSAYIYGCTDSLAFNYDSSATFNDGSCQYFTITCLPDSQYTLEGIYPDSLTGLPNAYVNQPYNEVLTAIIGLDTLYEVFPGFTSQVTIDSVLINNIAGLPSSFTYSCNPVSCSYAGGTSGCMNIFSVSNPTIADTGFYQLNIEYTIYASNIPIFGSTTLNTFNNDYSINIIGNLGCTDFNACNFDTMANIDDGSCIYNNGSINLSTNAWYIQHSTANFLEYIVTFDSLSLIYSLISVDSMASFSGSYIFCNDSLILDSIPGFHFTFNSNSNNFNGYYNTGNGSGPYYMEPLVLGCTYTNACNYNPLANVHDNSCVFVNCNPVYGCMDSLACNYDSLANINDSLSCIYISNPVVDLTMGQWIMEGDFGCDSVIDGIWYIDYQSNGTYIYSLDPFLSNSWPGLWSLCGNNYIDTDSMLSYWYTGTYSNGIFSGQMQNNSGCWIMYPNLGCTDSTAVNYNPTITIDDGSCLYSGCTDSTALNFNFNANIDDGSCIYCTNDTSYTNITACDSYTWDGVTYNTSGIYTNTYTNTNGCDSVHTLNLTLINSSSASTTVISCDSYTWDGVTYNASGVYTNTYTNTNGCDSIHTLSLTIINSSSGSTNVTSCDSYTWDGLNYAQSGMYTNTYTNVNGCDSVHTLNLTINNSYTDTFSITSCDNYLWNSAIYDSSGTYTNIFTGINGCDSIQVLDLIINTADTFVTNVTACDNYSWDGVIYSASGIYTTVYNTFSGCDSVCILYLTINNSFSETTQISICDSYVWHGITYDTSGLFTNVYTNAQGCDSIHILDLNIYNSDTISSIVMACDSFVWDSITYNSSGTYTNFYSNIHGCDSVHSLYLTISNSTNEISNITSCDSYVWDGVTYNVSGVYSNIYTNTNGCDSIYTINLTIDNSYNITNNQTLCFGDSLVIGNNFYSTSGVYIDSFPAVNGCDSIIISNLDITSQQYVNILQNGLSLVVSNFGGTPPYSFTWNTNEITSQITPLNNGVYWLVVEDYYGCQSDTVFVEVDWIPAFINNLDINNFKIYPNPSRDVFNISFTSNISQDLEITIKNLIGEEINKNTLEDYKGDFNYYLDLSSFSKGIYLLNLKTGKGNIIHRLILN